MTASHRDTREHDMRTYLSTLTVKTLREISKRIGFRFISRYRKAELISLIIAEINASHIEAIAENRYYGITAPFGTKVSAMDYPAAEGRVVTEAHTKICADKGCVSYVKNGIDQGWCPRCGNVTTSEEQITAEEIAGIVIAPESVQIPAMTNEYGFTAHGNTYAVDYNRIHEEMNRQALADMRMSHCDPIDDVIRFAREAIKSLMPTLLATKAAFESLRDDDTVNPNHIELAYQVYSDTHRAVEGFKRSCAYAPGDHSCENNYREVAMTDECAYGCKIYRCRKCQDERTLHNATYGCKGV